MTALRTLLAASSLPVLAAPADHLVFAPEPDSSVRKTLEISMEFHLDDFVMSVGGEDVTEMMGADASRSFTGEISVGVTEKYVKSGDGRPLDLLRTFDDLSLEMSDGSESEEVDEFAELEGHTVRFLWSSDDGEYDVSFHEDEGDEGLLESLSDDMDLRLLLPGDEVSEGDTWEVQAVELFPLFFPGGLPGSSSEEDDDEIGGLIKDQLGEQFQTLVEDFVVRCTYKGSRSADDVDVGEIVFEYDGQGSVDLVELIRSIAETRDEAPDLDSLTATLDLDLKGEGTLLWNTGAGRVHTFEMTSEMGVSIGIAVTASFDGQEVPIELDAELSGNGQWSLAAD